MLSGDEKMINIVNQLVEYIKKHDFANTDVSNIVEKDIPLDLSELQDIEFVRWQRCLLY